MKNNLFHILRYCILFSGIVILFLSCDSQKDSQKEVEKENNENVILVNTDVRDSLYHLYDSVSKLWQRSIKVNSMASIQFVQQWGFLLSTVKYINHPKRL
ncbi:MAG: hypothetical protein LW704_11230 [Cryomorphaceae bacterium]|nr:hypothetical protein [Cryomorphaceae bacterium]